MIYKNKILLKIKREPLETKQTYVSSSLLKATTESSAVESSDHDTDCPPFPARSQRSASVLVDPHDTSILFNFQILLTWSEICLVLLLRAALSIRLSLWKAFLTMSLIEATAQIFPMFSLSADGEGNSNPGWGPDDCFVRVKGPYLE